MPPWRDGPGHTRIRCAKRYAGWHQASSLTITALRSAREKRKASYDVQWSLRGPQPSALGSPPGLSLPEKLRRCMIPELGRVARCVYGVAPQPSIIELSAESTPQEATSHEFAPRIVS